MTEIVDVPNVTRDRDFRTLPGRLPLGMTPMAPPDMTPQEFVEWSTFQTKERALIEQEGSAEREKRYEELIEKKARLTELMTELNTQIKEHGHDMFVQCIAALKHEESGTTSGVLGNDSVLKWITDREHYPICKLFLSVRSLKVEIEKLTRELAPPKVYEPPVDHPFITVLKRVKNVSAIWDKMLEDYKDDDTTIDSDLRQYIRQLFPETWLCVGTTLGSVAKYILRSRRYNPSIYAPVVTREGLTYDTTADLAAIRAAREKD